MARLFIQASSEYLKVASAPVTGEPFTMACWFLTSSATLNQALMSVADKDATPYHSLIAAGGLGGDPLIAYSVDGGGGSYAETSVGYNTNEWHHACGIWVSSTDRRVFIDGRNKGTNAVSRTVANIDSIAIGASADSTPDNYVDGRICEAVIWEGILTELEVWRLWQGVSPWEIRPAQLVGLWLPFGDRTDSDYSGYARHMTAYNTPSFAPDAPKVIRPWRSNPQYIGRRIVGREQPGRVWAVPIGKSPITSISESDTVTVTDSAQLLSTILYLTRTETITVSDAATLLLAGLFASLSDSITVSDSVSLSPTTPSAFAEVKAVRTRPSLLVYDFDGKIKRLPTAINRKWSNHYGKEGSGFGYLTFELDRKIGFDYRDIQFGYRVRLLKGLATNLFDGQIRKITESKGNPDRIEVTALGWNVLFGDDVLNWVFCETRPGRWVGSETPSGSLQPDKFDYDLEDRLQFKPRRGVDFEADDYGYVRFTFPFGEVAERVKFDYDVALPNTWPGKLEVRDSNGTVLWSQTTTGSGTGEDHTTTGSPTYIEVRFYVTSAGENTAADDTVYGRLTNVKVYGTDEATLDAAVIAKKVQTVLIQTYHGLSADDSQIASPGLVLEPAAFDDDRFLDQIMAWACQFGDSDGNPLAWGVQMDALKRLFLETQDLTTIKYKILRDSALQAQVSGDWQGSHQKVYGIYTDDQGEVQRTADRTATAAMADLGDYARRRGLQIDGATDETTVLEAVDLYLGENDEPKVTSSFTVRGNIFTPALGTVRFDEIKAGGMVQVKDFRAREATLTPNDFRDRWTTFQLVGVEIDEDAHSARLIPAGDREGFERYMALLAQMREG